MRKFCIAYSLLFFSIKNVVTLRFGQLCDSTPMYRESWQYDDSCDNVYLFCDPSNGTCNYKGCSNADYIQGWDLSFRPYPTRCNGTTYCPDSGSQCNHVSPIGSTCEKQRDDECTGPNAICLNSICFIKGAPLGGNCGADITTYVSYDASGDSIQQTIIRDNCTEGTYCNLDGGSVCIDSKPLQSECEQDRECLSNTCAYNNICSNGPDTFRKIKAWLWGVLAACVVIFVLFILAMLWFLHRYQSRKEHEKISKFFGDNKEFAKYAMMNDNDSEYSFTDFDTNQSVTDSPGSVVYLTTPDYTKSQALTTKKSSTTALNQHRSNNNSTSRFSNYTPTPRANTPDI